MAVQRMAAFRGRAAERQQLDRLLDKVRAGESAALVVRGEAGIGKTALLNHCVGQALGFRIARIAGMQSEMELPFAGLHQLCAPMLNQLDRLPDPQQNALQVAFGLASGDPPDRFLVALATLSLLAEVARKRPLLCLIDDAQWLDAASGQAFGFVARRILGESLLMVFGVREPTEDHLLAGLPDLTLRGLSEAESRALLVAAIPGGVDANIRDRIVAETRGNPLALLELPKGMTTAELAGGFLAPHSTDLYSQLEEHFLRRFEALPRPTQRLMLIAAADPTGDVALLWKASEFLGIDRDAAAVGDAEQLLDIGQLVQFRHPLVRSAIYSGATPEDRRAVHLALAAALDPQTDPDRRAWHHALAASGPDEEVASELEGSASRAQARGGLAAAAAFLKSSVALTQDPGRRTDRALAAAQAQLHIGSIEEARHLLTVAEADAQNELQSARIDLLRGRIVLITGPGPEAPGLLLKAARRLEQLDIGLARATYLDALSAAHTAGLFGKNGELNELSQAARAAPTSTGPPRLSDFLLDGFSLLLTEGRVAALPVLHSAVEAFRSEELEVDKGLQWWGLAVSAAAALWDYERMAALITRQTEFARATGALISLYVGLGAQVLVACMRGDLAAAAAVRAEQDVISEATGIRFPLIGGLLLAAFRGDGDYNSPLIEVGVDIPAPPAEGITAQMGFWAEAVLSNGLARYDRALPLAQRASESRGVHIAGWALPELIEAAVRTGKHALAADALERLAESSAGSESDWARGMRARCQALIDSDQSAEEHYREAVECLGRTALRPELARAHLLYGEWLRRQRRRKDGREQLRSAHEIFDQIGMVGFAERALRELRATGETVRSRRDETRTDLTPQEEQIARLALDGRTNSEIGAQLYISARTVEFHLHKVFSKLGITSRKGLGDALPERTGNGS